MAEIKVHADVIASANMFDSSFEKKIVLLPAGVCIHVATMWCYNAFVFLRKSFFVVFDLSGILRGGVKRGVDQNMLAKNISEIFGSSGIAPKYFDAICLYYIPMLINYIVSRFFSLLDLVVSTILLYTLTCSAIWVP